MSVSLWLTFCLQIKSIVLHIKWQTNKDSWQVTFRILSQHLPMKELFQFVVVLTVDDYFVSLWLPVLTSSISHTSDVRIIILKGERKCLRKRERKWKRKRRLKRNCFLNHYAYRIFFTSSLFLLPLLLHQWNSSSSMKQKETQKRVMKKNRDSKERKEETCFWVVSQSQSISQVSCFSLTLSWFLLISHSFLGRKGRTWCIWCWWWEWWRKRV